MGPKKKLSKKEKARLAAEQAEQARIQAELEAKRREEEERIRQIEERKAAIEKEKRETAEHKLRAEQLSASLKLINSIKARNLKKALSDRNAEEWEHYLKCDGLPNPFDCGQLNTYLHLWEKKMEFTTIEDASARTAEILKLLDELTSLIDHPVGAKNSQLENWKWIHRLFRESQQKSMDTASYLLLRDIRKELDRSNLTTAVFEREEESYCLYLWLLLSLPSCMPNPRKPAQPRIDIDIPEMKLHVLFPDSVECHNQVIRVMYLKYDHLSDLCPNSQKPRVSKEYNLDLYKATLDEWNSKLYYKYENWIKSGADNTATEEAIVDRAAGIIPTVPYQKLQPSASVHVISEEDKMYLQTRNNLRARVDDHVVNLRKYTILGGTYHLNIFYQPPQPQEIVAYAIQISRLEMPKCLKEVPFHIRYSTPPPIDPTSKQDAEEIEEEIKKQEQELDQLLLVTVTLPEHIMWLDIPTVCQWDSNQHYWSTSDVHDFKHIEDKGYLMFRTGKFGCFGLASFRYSNMPYQAWELRPEIDGTVTLQITAAILLIEFKIKDDLVSVSQLQNTPNNALQEVIGVYYKLPKLIRILQEGGIDVFPEFDCFCYVEGTCEKHWPMERHTYYNMAQLSICYNFAWSRWNITAGRRRVVMQAREYKPEKVKQVNHVMLMVTPLKAIFVECTEVSQMFNDKSVEGMHFYSDLYHLIKGTSPRATKTKLQSVPYELVGAVADLLIATRVLSFS